MPSARTVYSAAAGDHADVVVIGGGIVGLATAYRLLEARPSVRLLLLEKEPALAQHQTGHNSGVVHAGLYYTPGSMKATLCRGGKAELEAFCEAHGIGVNPIGKLVVAISEDELGRFEDLHARATANGIPGLEVIGPDGIRDLEPHAVGIRALWSPTTGIVDFARVAQGIADEVRERGGIIQTSRPVIGLEQRASEVVLRTPQGEVVADAVIACAGLWADRVAAMAGDGRDDVPRIIPFRGDYYTLKPEARGLVRHLIYPVPDPRFPFLGVHFTPRHDGEVWAGPNAVLALARAGYRRRDVSVRDLAATLGYGGFWRLARKYMRTGLAEMWRDVSRRAFLADLRRYVPELRGDQLTFGPSGVRAQALDHTGALVDDFVLTGSGRVLNVANAPSPAATASLAIGRVLAARAIEQFGL